MAKQFKDIEKKLKLIVAILADYHKDFDCLEQILQRLTEENQEQIFREIWDFAKNNKQHLGFSTLGAYAYLEELERYYYNLSHKLI